MDNRELNTFDFNFDNQKDAISVAFFGRRRQGKGVLSYQFIRNLDKSIKGGFKRIFLFSQTAKYQKDDWDFLNPDDIFDNLENLFKIVEIRQENGNKDEQILIILDDFLNMKGEDRMVRNSKNLEKILTLGRHLGIAICVLAQKPTMCSKLMRMNFDYIFYACMRSEDENYMIRRENLGLCKNKIQRENIFYQVFKEPYCFMCVENHKSGVVDVYDYVSKIVAEYPRKKWKAKYLKRIIKNNKRSKNNNKNKDDFDKLK